jgi:hypothetical protein
MSINPLVPNSGNTQGQAGISSAGSQSGEQAFQDLTRSSSYDKNELDKAVSDRTRLTRTKRVDKSKKAKQNSLFQISDEGEPEEEPVYRTIMVDGILFTLRLLAVA